MWRESVPLRVRIQQLNRLGRFCRVCLLLAALLCGCGLTPTPANSSPDPSPTPTVKPKSEMMSDPKEEVSAEEERLSAAKDGFLWDDGFLQAIDEEGNLLTACYVGVLQFGLDGRYTSGSRELDELVAKVILENTENDMTRMEMLRAMYEYTIKNIRYIGQANYTNSYLPAHGKDGWMPELAIKALRDGYGNCYGYAAAFAALARGLGFQAYAVGGQVGATEDPHGWVEILDDAGNVWMNDPEIEYRMGEYQKQVQGKEPVPDLFYKEPDKIGAETGLNYRALCDPFAAEAKEAEWRRFGMIPVPVTQEATEMISSESSGSTGLSAPETTALTKTAAPANEKEAATK